MIEIAGNFLRPPKLQLYTPKTNRGNATSLDDHVSKEMNELNLIRRKYIPKRLGCDYQNLPDEKVNLSTSQMIDLIPWSGDTVALMAIVAFRSTTELGSKLAFVKSTVFSHNVIFSMSYCPFQRRSWSRSSKSLEKLKALYFPMMHTLILRSWMMQFQHLEP